MNDLGTLYRKDGWGLVTDKALQIDPADVESQARQVARWAYDRITELETALKEIVSDVNALRCIPNDEHDDNGHWFGTFSECDIDVDFVNVEWPNLSISTIEAAKALEGKELAYVKGPYWHNRNPWKDKLVYVTLDEINEIINYEPNWRQHDYRLDPYLLPSPDPEYFSAGVRFGPEGADYISLHIDQMKTQALFAKVKMRGEA